MHKNAEPAWQEYKTQQRIIDFLHNNLKVPLESIKKIAKTGLFLDLKGKAEPQGNNYCIALRADIDALPMSENNHDLPYRTVTKAAHMCGHDGHTVCLLAGTTRILN